MSRFSILDHHLEAPRGSGGGGKVVLSRLRPGRSPLVATSPSLKIVLDGEGQYEIDGRVTRLRAGNFLYLDAGEQCTLTTRADLVGLCVILPADSHPNSAGWAQAEGGDPVVGRSLVLSTRTSLFGRAFEDQARRIARNPELGHELAEPLLRQFDSAIHSPLGESRAAMAGLKVVKASTRRALFERLERARGHLHHNNHRNVALGELASIAGLSQFHLARYFKLAFGVAPIAYHRALRLDRAAELLAAESRSLSEVAEMTGYSDEVALSHAFRRRYGRAPQMWAMERRAS